MRFSVTSHAVTRYQERVKPGLDPEIARDELAALVHIAGKPHGKPEWLHLPEHTTDASEFYLTLSDGIVACLKRHLVVSVITRGGSNSKHRANKNAFKARRRAARKKPPSKPGRGKEALPRWR